VACASDARASQTSGFWTRSSSKSQAHCTTSGGQWIRAVKRFFNRLLRGLPYVPPVIITGTLTSYGAGKREVLSDVEHRQSRYLNNRAENSHRPTRRRERQMQRFKSPHQAQDFLSAYAFICGHFHPRRHRLAATNDRALRIKAFKSLASGHSLEVKVTMPERGREGTQVRAEPQRYRDRRRRCRARSA
jgi:hypothetical protein